MFERMLIKIQNITCAIFLSVLKIIFIYRILLLTSLRGYKNEKLIKKINTSYVCPKRPKAQAKKTGITFKILF